MKKVLILDTSILCVWLNVPGMADCGPKENKWDRARVAAKISDEEKDNTTFVLPLATIVETGNHIVHAAHSRRARAEELADLIRKSADGKSPWAAFSDQSVLWSPEKLGALATEWPTLADQQLSLGDATIKDVAEYYSGMGFYVEILTGDTGLKAYEPAIPPDIPRRKQRS